MQHFACYACVNYLAVSVEYIPCASEKYAVRITKVGAHQHTIVGNSNYATSCSILTFQRHRRKCSASPEHRCNLTTGCADSIVRFNKQHVGVAVDLPSSAWAATA